MSAAEDLALLIGGQRYAGFTEASIGWGQDKAAITFGLKVMEPAWSSGDVVPFLGEVLELRTRPVGSRGAGDLLVKGHVDTYEADAETGSHEVRITGRSKGADAIDSSAKHPTGRVEGKDLLGAAKELIKESGIKVEVRTDTKLEKVPKLQVRPGETVFAAIERVARRQGVLISTDPDGTLVLTKPKGERAAGSIVEGHLPLKSAGVKFDLSGVRNPISVRGQRASGTGKDALRQDVTVFDPTAGRFRPLELFVEGDATDKELRKRAETERRRQSADAKVFSPKLFGWRDENGQLWKPGKLIAVDAPTWHIKGDLLIKDVTFLISVREGTVTTLTLIDPRANGGTKPGGTTGKAWAAGGDDDAKD